MRDRNRFLHNENEGMTTDAFDPDRLLDSFHAQVAASQRQIDLDTVLGGWNPDPTGSRLHRQTDLKSEAVRFGRQAALRRRDIGEVVDATDIGSRHGVPETGHNAHGAGTSRSAPAAHGGALPVRVRAGRPRDRRLLANWAAGSWVGACRQVSESTTEVGTSPLGPVVDVHAPQALFALWAPRADRAHPMPGRWPSQVSIGDLSDADPVGAACELLLPLLPDEAALWLCDEALDWALLAELVLHHEPALKPFQLAALRSFAEAERSRDFQRVNDGYMQPAPGRPVQRR